MLEIGWRISGRIIEGIGSADAGYDSAGHIADGAFSSPSPSNLVKYA
jgi:hypothetical protein